jgi:hypothetical protein
MPQGPAPMIATRVVMVVSRVRARSAKDHRLVLVDEHPVFQVVFQGFGKGYGFGVAADGDQRSGR